MLFEKGNAAKQWMLEELDRRYGKAPARILDLACGNGRIWERFLKTHPNIRVTGIDSDERAILQGKTSYQGNTQINLQHFDAQKLIDGVYDSVMAMSAIEHVVDHPAFLRTVWNALSSGGVAYLNYDSGHFRSNNVKERLMVPISQLLALFGAQGSYMKRVDDKLFCDQIRKQGFNITDIKKHNLYPLKGFMRAAEEEAVKTWYEFENKLNQMYLPEELEKVMWSTTVVVKKG
ncbi:MAG: class I SAM-dependent methyltransferase [Patescibacteria group bacterium]|nr:class I SAM-dependent methyltransferase [Patescibacteria group bacterium]MBU2509410.1 class I SAM-dependent methyltransferase [Patescibacteria group bacterium]